MTDDRFEEQEVEIESEAEEAEEPEEPWNYDRISHYAIGAFVISMLAFQRVSFFGPLFFARDRGEVWRLWVDQFVLPALFPIGAALFAVILATKAEEQIERSEGHLGGVAFAKTARWAAYLTVSLIAAALVVLLIASEAVPGRNP